MNQVMFNQGYQLPEDFGGIDDIFFVNSGWVKLTSLTNKSVYMPREAFVYIVAGEAS